VIAEPLLGEASVEGRRFGALARRIATTGRPIRRPAVVVAGGEPTVTVRGRGKGGRAQEFALAAARGIAGLHGVWIAALGTDGTDGPTEAAGAVVDGSTVDRAGRIGVDLSRALRRNDSHGFFRKTGGHIVTGPTGTNVNDLYLILFL
jgi:glycerate-2-kinase